MTPKQPGKQDEVTEEYIRQAQKLGYSKDSENATSAIAVTAQDPIIVTEHGERLPAVPLDEALKLNRLKCELEGEDADKIHPEYRQRQALDGTVHGILRPNDLEKQQPPRNDVPLGRAVQ